MATRRPPTREREAFNDEIFDEIDASSETEEDLPAGLTGQPESQKGCLAGNQGISSFFQSSGSHAAYIC